jgi:hypothetical protein
MFDLIAKLFDPYSKYGMSSIITRYKNVPDQTWRNYYKRVLRKEKFAKRKNQNSSGSMIRSEEMALSVRTAVIRGLQKGKSLRQIGNAVGLDSKAVYRVGAKEGVYSVRSKKNGRRS